MAFKCMAPGCVRVATRGEAWSGDELVPIERFQKGIRLQLAVKDMAVRLVLCDEHANDLTVAAWKPVLEMLADWGWRPLSSWPETLD